VAKELKSWPRPHFVPNGGTPLLYYAVFGAFDLKLPLSKSKYRTSGMPDWIEILSCERGKDPEAFQEYQSGPMWEKLSLDTPLTANEAERAPECIIVRGEPEDPSTLDYFRDTIGILAWLLDAGGAAIYDPQMLWLWSPEEWREDAFGPNEPNPERHTAILLTEEEDGTCWYRTRGMRKFGRPDLSVHGVMPKHADGVSLLIERFVEFQAHGGVIPDREQIRMKALPHGAVCRHRGSLDDPDFNNVYVEIEWEGKGLK
jgi:hypothetical protein